MTIRLSRLLLALALPACSVLAIGLALPHALAGDDQALARRLSATGQILPLEKIIARARTIKAGKVLETELEDKKGRYVYEVEVLDRQGQVWEVKLDARTGALIELENDD